MAKPLIIVESPAKCKKIESFLDNKYKCIASFGHVRELKDGLKCIDIDNNFKPKFSLCSRNKNISKIISLVRESSDVYLATDDDREGEAIAWHICIICKLPVKSTKRIIFHEITKTAIQRSLQNVTTINMNTVNSQLSRVVLDRLVGFMISPILWKNINRKSGLSAGRCQTPALRLVYENQKQIDENPGEIVYNTTGYFTKKNIVFNLDKNFDSKDKMEEFLEESVNFDHVFSKKDIKQVSRKPPEPFTTSTLQQCASNVYHYSPKATMKYAQTLYENGLITYMRTDSKTYSKEFIESAKIFIGENYDENYIHTNIDILSTNKTSKSTKKKKNDNAQEAHEAIRPTNINVKDIVDSFSNQEKNLYYLIWKNSVQSCMSDAKVNVLECVISAPFETKYKHSEEQIVFLGWKILDKQNKETYFEYLKVLKSGNIDYKKIKSVQTLKKTIQHFTEARLVQLLEKKGIGRPSTFSSLISKIQERNYVKKENVEGKKIKTVDFVLVEDTIEEQEVEKIVGQEKNKLVLQQLGKIVLEFLLNHYEQLFNYDFTSNMEQTLDTIMKGDKIWHEPCKEYYDVIREINSNMKEPEKNKKDANKIDEHHTYIVGKYGPCIKCEKDGNTSFKKIKKGLDVDLEKLAQGQYKLTDLIEENENKPFGTYKDLPIYIKTGKYGDYVSYNNKNYSIKTLKNRNLEEIIKIINGDTTAQSNVKRTLNNNLSIRTGKYGPYIYFKTNKMKKPKFLSLKGCSLDIELATNEEYLDYIKEKYEVE